MGMIQHKEVYIFTGFIWCLLFAIISFYWAGGGMIGVNTLGGFIYNQAIEREASFIAMVWLTGFVKLCGGLFLLLLLRPWSSMTNRVLYVLGLLAGILLFLYGLTNVVSLIFACIGLLSLQIDDFALRWRLFFWEPFWMLGGALFILAALKFKREAKSKS
ncbi:hypothetical protein BK138_25010 [Paenibacillus rhizosphaerae]|uniref:DUF3995 domain-containing protein n=2 Tax=Paenibacillus TaxID=44249 RepID=A0A1R1EIR6_9BACL|nr:MULTISPECIES: DUF3995 domain-containing protein [Paenibacillus]OMF51708.1 hypothetical protein BK138_25010 [Paenibacillus rhizosphaerae]GIO57606.1 hypothetical protein J21TS7_59240 [Paenibacillus cineris]